MGAHGATRCNRCHRIVTDRARVTFASPDGKVNLCESCWGAATTVLADSKRTLVELESYYRTTYGLSLAEYGDLYIAQGERPYRRRGRMRR